MWHNYNTKAYLLGKLLLAPRLVYFDDSRLNALDPGAKSSDPNRTGYTIAVLIGDDHKSASDVFTLSNGMYGGSWYDGIQLPVHELPDCVRDANLCSSKVSHADAVAIAAANGLKISESSASFTIDFASSSGNGWAWFVQSTDETPTTECKQGTVSTMEINITTSKTSSVKSVCYFRPIPLENDGKVTVLQKPEVQTLIGKYNVGEVQLKALKFSYIQDKGFMERLLPIFKGKDIGCIIILKTPEVSKVYVEDENLQTFEELDYQTFNQYLNKASTADRQLFLDNLH
jgi:hypothetical protein